MNCKILHHDTRKPSPVCCRPLTAPPGIFSSTLTHKERKPALKLLPMDFSDTTDTSKSTRSPSLPGICFWGFVTTTEHPKTFETNWNFIHLKPYDFCDKWLTNSGLEIEASAFEKGKEYDVVISNVNKKLGWVFCRRLLRAIRAFVKCFDEKHFFP